MRKIVVLCGLLAMVSLCACAQDYFKGEVFGGLQYTSLDTFNVQRSNLAGWTGEVTKYFRGPLALTGDISGTYGSPSVGGEPTNLHLYSFLFGPTFRVPMGKSTPFVHSLFGVAHMSNTTGTYSSSGLAWSLGGGFDVEMSRNFSLRAVQLDYLGTKLSDATNSGNTRQNNLRIAAGVVVKF